VDEDTQIRRSRSPGGILIEIVGGPMDGMSRRASESSLSIGRSEDNDLPLLLTVSVSSQRMTAPDREAWIDGRGRIVK
jgi:hypothetical protein